MKLRTMGEGNPKRTGTTMTFVQGKPVEQLEVVLDTVEDKMELWMRIRAWLFTMAYCAIDKPDFFPLQDAMQTSEHFLKLLTATYRKQRPPVQHMVEAWDNTIHSWSEDMRMTERTAKVVICTFSTWEGKFSWSPPTMVDNSVGGGGNGGGNIFEADNRKLQNTVLSLQGQIKQMQAQAKADKAGGSGNSNGKWGGNGGSGKGKQKTGKDDGNNGGGGGRGSGGWSGKKKKRF